ncbi:MAG: hypothetical protein WAM98_02230 [Terriglobales bacterium]
MSNNFMGPSEKTQHAIRRSTRLSLEVPVLVTSLNPELPFSAAGNTTLVNAHGCGLILSRPLAQGVEVQLEIVSAKRCTTARVVEVVPLGGDPAAWLIGLELGVPGNFWGIEYAPSDWKIEARSSPLAGQPHADLGASAAAKPARSRRWRLTDISAGACYLETATPFPAETPVLLSIRTLDAECLLDGVVRVSHAQTGMGVEFTGEPAKAQHAKVEELISRLMSHHEVPKVFVGRKEHVTPGRHGPANQAGRAALDGESPDPLLDLMREGPALTPEQFLSDLRSQRLGNRRDPRIDLALPVLLTGTDTSGRPLDQRVMTVNISRCGALLEGTRGILRVGDIVFLARLDKKEQFRVVSVGSDHSPSAGQVGVTAVDPNTSFWSEVLEATAHWLEIASLREDDSGDAGGTAR